MDFGQVHSLNQQQKVTFLPFNDEKALENELKKGDVCAVIFEAIQGVGGLDNFTSAPSSTVLGRMFFVLLLYRS